MLVSSVTLVSKLSTLRHANDIRFEKYKGTKLKCDIFDTKW